MDFFKFRKLRKAHIPNGEKDSEDNKAVVPQPQEINNENGVDESSKSDKVAPVSEAEDDDDDFITNEVKRRLKELRRKSFMVLIPEEEPCPEDEGEEEGEEEEVSSSEWRDVEAEGRQWWGGFDTLYDTYCDRMLFFDRMIVHQLDQDGCKIPATPSPRSASKRLASPLRCLSLKKIEEPDDESEHLRQLECDPYLDVETAYVAQICLTWEALHCQYTQLKLKISCQPESSTCYNHSAQQFQQFQVLLQRLIENEPFEQGLRAEIYARTRRSMPKLLQVPNIQGSDRKELGEEESDTVVLAPDLIRIIESSILTFHLFLKMDKKTSNMVHNLFGNQNQNATPLQQIQSLLDKKGMKLKEVRKKSKSWKKKSWPHNLEDVQLLFSLIDVKVISRVLTMGRVTKEQLFWSEEKMKKLDLRGGKLRRDPCPLLFPN